MNTDIRFIFFDLGGTFRVIREDPAYLAAAKTKIAELCGVQVEDPCAWFDTVIEKRYDKYREWALKFMCEAPEEVLWTRWLAYDCDRDLILKNAGELTYQYRQTKGIRTVVDGGAETVKELCARGYTLGIIANTVTETEIPDWMAADGVAQCFKTTILSSKVRLRKPDPAIYHLACRCIGSPEAQCAYVGDNPVRDVEGTQAAGFAMMIRIDEPDTLNMEKATGKEFTPDHVITSLRQLLDIFPARN